jgi:hypothetical protein
MLHYDHFTGTPPCAFMRSLLCLFLLLAAPYLFGMEEAIWQRQQAPCPCYACIGITLPRDRRTIASHMEKQREIEEFYLNCSVPSANLAGDVLRDAPPVDPLDALASFMDDDADPEKGEDYIDSNPIHSLPGWDECVTVGTQYNTHHVRRRTSSHIRTCPSTPTGRSELQDTRRGRVLSLRLANTPQSNTQRGQRCVGLRRQHPPREQHLERLRGPGEDAQDTSPTDYDEGTLLQKHVRGVLQPHQPAVRAPTRPHERAPDPVPSLRTSPLCARHQETSTMVLVPPRQVLVARPVREG